MCFTTWDPVRKGKKMNPPLKRISEEKPKIIDELERLDFRVFTGSAYDLNIIGARSPSREAGLFDDWVHVVYRLGGKWYEEMFPCSTDPGLYWLDNPMRVAGTAIICSPQQIRAGYELGSHRGQYECLVPRLPIKVWRDNNRDSILDTDGQEFDGYGIQIHRSSRSETSTRVGKWSAGCVVLSMGWSRFMELVHLQKHNGFGSLYTLTMVDGVFL